MRGRLNIATNRISLLFMDEYIHPAVHKFQRFYIDTLRHVAHRLAENFSFSPSHFSGSSDEREEKLDTQTRSGTKTFSRLLRDRNFKFVKGEIQSKRTWNLSYDDRTIRTAEQLGNKMLALLERPTVVASLSCASSDLVSNLN